MDSKTSLTTHRLLAAARRLDPIEAEASGEERLRTASQGFVEVYRSWIDDHHGWVGTPQEKMDRVRLVMLAMLTATDLRGALDILGRFAPLSFNDLSPVTIREEGDCVEIRLDCAARPGMAGLIAELWPLSMYLSLLEFLLGSLLGGVVGKVRHADLLPEHTAALLFDRPVESGSDRLALCIPRQHLKRAVVATPEQVMTFLPRLLPSALERTGTPVEFTTLVETLVRTDLLRGLEASCRAELIAEKLGCGPATLRRRLAQEGTSFRRIRSEVFDSVAKHWLRDRRLTIAQVAERLGYVDDFSFRRAFVRMNGLSPSAYRRQSLGA